MPQSAWTEVYDIVRLIPAGRVMNYGQVAALCCRPLTPRAVGWALRECPDNVPWYRVVNAAGGCSTDRAAGGEKGRQRRLLEGEGVRFRRNGTLDMSTYRFTLDTEQLDDALIDAEAGL